MAYILNIETATTNCSVSLSYKGETLVLKEDNSKNYSHAERLHVYINTVLNEADISKQQLDAVAVSKGPGSYTGLRIGVSAAKGLCFALDVPLIAISTLQSLALQSNTTEGLVIPLLDARRMEVYSAIFDNNNQCLREVQAQIIEPSSFSEFLEKGKVSFIGNGVTKTKEVISHNNAIFIEDKLPSAKQLASLSYKKFKISDFEDVAYFEPYYLKDFIALKSKKI